MELKPVAVHHEKYGDTHDPDFDAAFLSNSDRGSIGRTRVLVIDSSDPDLVMDDGRAYYKAIPFSGQVATLAPDQTEIESLTYVDGYLHGQADGWYPDDTRKYSGSYDHGRRVLDWEYWDEHGRLVRYDTFDFSGNLRHRKRWDEAGTLIEDFDAAANAKPLLDSAVERTNPALSEDGVDGRLLFHGQPFTGQTVRYFYEGGPVVALEWFADGYSDGPELGWHGDGARQYAGTTARNRPFGLWLHWHHNGTLAQQNVFSGSGRQISKSSWADSGESIADVVTSATHAAHVRHEGELDPATPVLHEGEPFTGVLERCAGAMLLSVQEYSDGHPDGLYIEYRDKREVRKGVNSATGPVGCWYEFDPDGRIRGEDCYDAGSNLLLRRRCDSDGALESPMEGLAIRNRRTGTPKHDAGKASE
ncbi:hypothetical protein [Nocardia sp. NPDC050717]|uniref:toxin-antitoxin system YwqK family antitoxin n=1 Tax=Nocardia sp. NPDC050717 TaxID=3157221 RepID=UPI0033F4786D